MKVIGSLLFAFSLFCSIYGQSIDTISTDISAVTVYSQGAMLKRSNAVSLSEGIAKVVIGDLPLEVDESTINIFTSDHLILLSEKLNRQYVDFNEIRSKYDVEKLKLQDSLDYINMLIDVSKGQETLLNNNRSLQNEESGFTTQELDQLNAYYGVEMLKVKKKIFALNLRKRKIEERIKKINQQMNQEGATQSKGSAYLVLEFDVKRSGRAEIELDYFVNNAGWTPQYDLRMEGLSKDLKIVYKASVYQNTGEDWDNVQLSLSTAEPRVDYTLPQMDPYYLNFNNYYRSNARMQEEPEMLEEVVVTGYAKASAVHSADMGVDQYTPPTSISKSQTSFDYVVEQAYSIPTSGVEQTVTLQTESVPVTYQYISMPKISNKAFLTATISDWESLNLLYGEANIFIENKYSGKTYIGEDQDESDYTISLGKDDNIVVMRELKKGYEKSKFIGSNKVETRIWNLSVKNNKSESISIKLMDQYPISQNGAIKIDLKEKSNAEEDKDRGMLTWEMSVAPVSKWSGLVEYEVKYPKDRNLTID